MLKNLKDGLTNIAQNQYDETQRKNALVKTLFEDKVEQANDYIIGVAQIETESTGIAAAVTKIALDSIMVDWKDYIVGIHQNKKEVILLEIDDEKVKDSLTFNDTFQLKKESVIVDELLDMVLSSLKISHTPRGDRHKRDRYVLNHNNLKYRLLVGSHVPEDTHFPYDNTNVISRFKSLIKDMKK